MKAVSIPDPGSIWTGTSLNVKLHIIITERIFNFDVIATNNFYFKNINAHTMDIDTRNRIISGVLAVIIIGLAWVLYDSITSPFEEVERQREITEQVRHRLSVTRDALVEHNRREGSFPEDLDDLVEWLKTNDEMVEKGDSLFAFRPPNEYDPDSVIYSPRSGARFHYALNDTIRPNIYLLEDPDSDDHIGSLERTNLLNATNWN